MYTKGNFSVTKNDFMFDFIYCQLLQCDIQVYVSPQTIRSLLSNLGWRSHEPTDRSRQKDPHVIKFLHRKSCVRCFALRNLGILQPIRLVEIWNKDLLEISVNKDPFEEKFRFNPDFGEGLVGKKRPLAVTFILRWDCH